MDRRVSALKIQKKNPNRVNVYLDGQYAFGIARILAAYLKIGQILSDDQMRTMQEKDEQEVALQKALHFIGYRPRAIQEVKSRLAKGGFEERVIEETIVRLEHGGVLGDEQFARNWVENRNTFRPRSKRLLAMELRQKGIGNDIIESVLEVEQVDDSLLCYQAAIKYMRRLEGLEWQVFRKRLSDYLARRGFNYSTVQPTVQKVWDESSIHVRSEYKMREEESGDER